MAKMQRGQPLNNPSKNKAATAMSPQDDDTIRRRAYTIWEREGRPHGRHEDHWHRARKELSAATEPEQKSESEEAARRRKNK